MSTPHGSAIIGDVVAGAAAAVSAIGVFHEFAFHEVVGTTAGLMAIAYYLYQFAKWVRSHWDNNNGA